MAFFTLEGWVAPLTFQGRVAFGREGVSEREVAEPLTSYDSEVTPFLFISNDRKVTRLLLISSDREVTSNFMCQRFVSSLEKF